MSPTTGTPVGHSRSSAASGGRPQRGWLSTASSYGVADHSASAAGCRHATAIRRAPRLDPPYRAALRRTSARTGRPAQRPGVGLRGGTGQPVGTCRPGGGAGVRRRRAVAVPLAGRRAAPPGAPVRPAAPAVAGRAPGRGPCRPGRRGDPQRRAGHRALRRRGGRPTGGHRGPRRRFADHPRAGPTGGTPRPAGHRRYAAGRAPARPSGLPGRSLLALGAAARRGVPRPLGAARPGPGAPAPGRRLQCRRGQRAGAGGVSFGGVGAGRFSVGRAGPAGARPAARTRRPCCRPDRSAAATPGRSSSSPQPRWRGVR